MTSGLFNFRLMLIQVLAGCALVLTQQTAPAAATATEHAIESDPAVIVMRAVFDVATANNLQAKEDQATGDALTEILVRSAASAALSLEAEAKRESAFLIAVSLCLDDSKFLSMNPFLRKRIAVIKQETKHSEKINLVKSAKMNSRRDLAQHFFISVGFFETMGREFTLSAGLSKELHDAQHGTGFSFVDLQADHAGVAFAHAIHSGQLSLQIIAESFTVASVLPEGHHLEEGLSYEEFGANFLNTEGATNEAFEKLVNEIDEAVSAQYDKTT